MGFSVFVSLALYRTSLGLYSFFHLPEPTLRHVINICSSGRLLVESFVCSLVDFLPQFHSRFDFGTRILKDSKSGSFSFVSFRSQYGLSPLQSQHGLQPISAALEDPEDRIHLTGLNLSRAPHVEPRTTLEEVVSLRLETIRFRRGLGLPYLET